MLDDTIDQLLVLVWAPVLALLDIEVLQVERPIVEDDVFSAEGFPHVGDVLDFLVVEIVVVFLAHRKLFN